MATSTDLRAAIEEVQEQLPAEQLDGVIESYDQDWATKVQQRVGALPWWVISAVVHAVIFLLATLLTVALPPAQVDEVIISTDVVKQEEQKYDENKERDIFQNKQEVVHETKVEKPVVVHEEAPIEEQFQTDNDMDQNTARGHEDAISDIPLGGTGVTGSMGVGGGGMAGCFGYRDGGGRKRAVARFGGSPATESAVEAALRWLARHQDPDGSWKSAKWEGHKGTVPGVTGLAVLAFLGAGYTEKSGKFRDNVRRGVKWLIDNQRDDGAIGVKYSEPWHGSFGGYNHPIAGLALAEAYGMAKNPEVGKAAQKAVDYSLSAQGNYSGWRYKPQQKADISVTGWYVMQMKSARIAGLKTDNVAFQGALKFADECTNDEGMVGYQNNKRVAPSLTGVGMVIRQFIGMQRTEKVMIQGGGVLTEEKNLPAWDAKNGKSVVGGAVTFYHWYYGTLAMFQMGGDGWRKWNTELKKTLLPNQCKGGPLDGSENDKDGSWDLLCRADKAGGRAYTTAVGALCLEVYYRYLPMYTK
ncbi:MAG: prenyltransferase/squalene oxidase repeat-containing protein [Planctomycetota bacterium]|jgi:hypothetical protein